MVVWNGSAKEKSPDVWLFVEVPVPCSECSKVTGTPWFETMAPAELRWTKRYVLVELGIVNWTDPK